jgi:hypothetical protein
VELVEWCILFPGTQFVDLVLKEADEVLPRVHTTPDAAREPVNMELRAPRPTLVLCLGGFSKLAASQTMTSSFAAIGMTIRSSSGLEILNCDSFAGAADRLCPSSWFMIGRVSDAGIRTK